MTVKEYAEYLLDNFPHDAPVMKTGWEDPDYLFPVREPRIVYSDCGLEGFPEEVDQIVVI